jgi:pimeloyl-ACP methyl ester carboxylesterase
MGRPIAWPCRFTFGPENPAFDHGGDTLKAKASELGSNPKPLTRPVLVFSGYRVPGIFGGQLATNLARLTSGHTEDFRMFAYPFDGDIEPLVNRLAKQVGREFGLDSSGDCTNAVDVVGISMGGIVGRLGAARSRIRPAGVPRINIRNLFTIATPHRGARLALKIHVDRAATDMQPNSPFLAKLDEYAEADDYTLVPYATLNDITVGAANCSPPDADPIWIRGTRLFAHTTVTMHPALVLDIALRLRGEQPLGAPSPIPPH